MMATEAVDARHEAILCLERARLAIEADELDEAEERALAAVPWIRAITPGHSLEWDYLSPEAKAAWRYRP